MRSFRLRRLLLGADLVALALTFVLLDVFRVASGDSGLLIEHPALLLLAAPAWIALAAAHDLYHLHRVAVESSAPDELGPVLQMTVVWSWCVLLAAEVLSIDGVTVAQVALFWGFATILLILLRGAVRMVARRSDWYVHRTLVVGERRRAGALARKLERHPEYGLDVVGVVGLSHAAPARRNGELPRVVRGEDVCELVEEHRINRVVLADPPRHAADKRLDLARELGERGVRVDLLPSWSDVLGTRLEVHELEGTSMLTVPYVRLGRSALIVKRTFDVVVSALGLVALLPLFVVIAIAIKIDSRGPIFFRQRRIGRWGVPFELVKFRSMTTDADGHKDDVAELNLHGNGNGNRMFKVRNDPRVTRVGAWLRRTSLDEIPQLWNILRGQMSVVGPRPLIELEARQVEGRYLRRLALTPGLTGLWQVNGRSEVPFDAMVNLDYLYCTTWSLWGDIRIILGTLPAVLSRRGAY